MKDLLIATTNRSKVEPFLYSCRKLGLDKLYRFVNPKELGIDIEVEENSGSFVGDSELKARAYCRASGLMSISFDRGIEFEALGGWPGTESKKELTGNDKMILGVDNRYESDVTNTQKLLDKLNGTENRTIYFGYGIALAIPNGEVISEGVRTRGTAANELRITKLGYYFDWFFIPEGKKNTLSEMTPEEYADYTAATLWPITPKILERLKNESGE
ncbi:MAG: non-canonical purine NTP pyrophosphatase [Microgenomates group bacterium]